MKKLILGFLLIFGISSTLLAEVDFIALATNGEFNEQSAGVKVLNDEEMRQDVGGAYLYIEQNNMLYRNKLNEYGITNNSGTKISYTAYYLIISESSDYEYGRLNVDDGTRRCIPAVSATLNHLTNQVSVSVIGVNQYNPVYARPADRYYANKLLEKDGGKLINQANRLIRIESRSYKY
ncbi:hypothetical protein [Helicobacter rodentium]|uniref:hypothetical protein n=1 Tax=Helicobacter rodentium TaxID=59617 RepID=UPI000478DF6F|nr:hypothetical protein [Helicobacter rodentium]